MMDAELTLDGELECRICGKTREIQNLNDVVNAYREGWRGWRAGEAVFMVCEDCRGHRLFNLNNTFDAIIKQTIKEIKE